MAGGFISPAVFIKKGAIMKVLSKMDSDVTYTIGKEKFLLLKNQECELDRRVAEHPVFKIHLANGGVVITGDQGEPKCGQTKKADDEVLRQELLKQCKEKGIKVMPNTGIAKLKEKLGV